MSSAAPLDAAPQGAAARLGERRLPQPRRSTAPRPAPGLGVPVLPRSPTTWRWRSPRSRSATGGSSSPASTSSTASWSSTAWSRSPGSGDRPVGDDRPPCGQCPKGATIERDVSIGTGAKVIGPVRIGAGRAVGANAVVVDDVPRRGHGRGVPARPCRSDRPRTCASMPTDAASGAGGHKTENVAPHARPASPARPHDELRDEIARLTEANRADPDRVTRATAAAPAAPRRDPPPGGRRRRARATRSRTPRASRPLDAAGHPRRAT